MNAKRYLKAKIGWWYSPWNRWHALSFSSLWSGRILYLNISKITIHLDCRESWLSDMVTGKPA